MKKLLLLSFMLIANTSFAFDVGQQVTAALTTTSAKAADKNIYRIALVFDNLGADIAYCKFKTAHTGTEGINLAVGAHVVLQNAPNADIYCKAAATTTSVNITEVTQ